MNYLYKTYSEQLSTLLDKIYQEEDYNEKPCETSALTYAKYQAAFALASIIKKDIEENVDLDWKTKYEYSKVKDCLACYNIDFESILQTAQVVCTSSINYLNDIYKNDFLCIYSFRKVFKEIYSTYCIRLKDTNTDKEYDIPYNICGFLDIAYIESLGIVSGSNYITRFYGQVLHSVHPFTVIEFSADTIDPPALYWKNGSDLSPYLWHGTSGNFNTTTKTYPTDIFTQASMIYGIGFADNGSNDFVFSSLKDSFDFGIELKWNETSNVLSVKGSGGIPTLTYAVPNSNLNYLLAGVAYNSPGHPKYGTMIYINASAIASATIGYFNAVNPLIYSPFGTGNFKPYTKVYEIMLSTTFIDDYTVTGLPAPYTYNFIQAVMTYQNTNPRHNLSV